MLKMRNLEAMVQREQDRRSGNAFASVLPSGLKKAAETTRTEINQAFKNKRKTKVKMTTEA